MVFRTSCFLQIILTLPLLAGDYYVTYSLASKQLVLSSEKVVISRAIVPFKKSKVLYTSQIENSEPFSKNENEFIKEHKEKIVEKLLEYDVLVSSYQKNYNLEFFSEKTEVKFGPVPMKIDFNDDFVTIKIVQE